MGVMMTAIASEEGHEEGAEDIESGDACRDSADPEHPWRVFVSRRKDRVLAIEAGEERKARDGEARDAERDEGNRHGFAEAAHVANILFSAESVDHAAGAEEQQRFEEGVCHDVEHTGGISANAQT